MKNADCTVLVTSCDGYLDVVDPFARLKAKYWPDCPFETVLLSETLPAEPPRPAFDRVILTGRGKTWCQMLVEALDRIDTPYVLMLMNDYYLEAPVDTPRLLRRLEQAKRYDAASLRLNPNPVGRGAFAPEDGAPVEADLPLLEFPKNEAYCVTCQTSVWNRAFLRGLAARNKSAWEFERFGSFMLGDEMRPLLVTPAKEFPFLDAVHKGFWEPWGVRVLKENGIACDFSKRGTPPCGVRVREGMKKAIFAFFPWTLIVRVQNLLGVGMKEKKRC